MTEKLSILIVEDLITDFELAVYEIRKMYPAVNCERVDSKDAFVNLLQSLKPDIIISDFIMPEFNGMAALMLKKKLAPDIPFIMLTGSTNEETAVECMKAGADDYVIKEHIKRLPHSVSGALANSKAKREIKRTQQELIRRELLLRNAVNNLPSTFIIYDNEQRIEYINEYGLTFWNISSAEAIGKREEDIIPREITENYLPVLNDAFEKKERRSIESRIKYGENYRYVIFYFIPTLDENGELYKVINIAYDITERKEAEEILKQAILRAEEYDMLKSAFLANISHEIRTPLNAIMGFSQMIRKNYAFDEQILGFTDIIMLSSNQLLDIIKEMLEVSQLVSGKSNINYTTFSISELIVELYEHLCVFEESKIKQGIEFNFNLDQLDTAHDKIISDREKLYHILKNLLGNAFKFTYTGSISFGCQKDKKGPWQFYVQDTGIGIEESKLNVIFDTFRKADESFTRKYRGVGLGLTICKELVELMGGKIWAESKEGKGSVFTFVLPENNILQH